ncbi:hypothetical protein AAFP30_02325 [Gordonia sp. CPCC 205515]|uniref:hypothetical protein n=1 Tax=Gordonia sp. CPCC 205515 TaxID=3140791 RepID=UPI003AF33E78
MKQIKVTAVQVSAARARVLLDEATGDDTPETIRKLATTRLREDVGDDWREQLRRYDLPEFGDLDLRSRLRWTRIMVQVERSEDPAVRVSAARALVLVNDATGTESSETLLQLAATRLPTDSGVDWREEMRRMGDQSRGVGEPARYRAS